MTTLTVWGGQRVNWVFVLFLQFTEVDYYTPGWFIFKDSTATLTTMEENPSSIQFICSQQCPMYVFFFSTVVYFIFYFYIFSDLLLLPQ